jgi:hypothetical protein
LLGSAILAHEAFIPGRVGRRDETADRMRAARTYARRGPASAEFLAWLDAVEAECETISGHTREALRLIGHAEDILAAGSQYTSPDWFTWFSPARLAAFKGNTQLKAGHLPQANRGRGRPRRTIRIWIKAAPGPALPAPGSALGRPPGTPAPSQP